jgi:hypothetical protein
MLQINRKNLGTDATGEDIFVVTQPGAKFSNFGKLATTGDLASTIRVSADGVTVTNLGTLSTSGDGSPAIVVGDPFGQHYNNVSIANHGTISASGFTVDDGFTLAFADGIDIFGNASRVINYGTISVTGDGVGIESVGANSTIINRGQIDAPFAGIIVDVIDGTEVHNSVVNSGVIHTLADFARGILVFTGDNLIQNFGAIRSDGFHSYGIYMEGDGNRAENFGTILVTGDEGRGVALQGEHLEFENFGTIRTTGVDSIGVRSAGENLPGTDSGNFINHGTVQSAGWAVLGADSSDHVVNYGLLAGAVDLGGGNDSYLAGHGSQLAGELILGDGDDLVICQRGFGDLTIADFMVGGATEDVLDLSSYGFASLDDLLAHALQSGSDVLLTLSGHDHVLLENTALADLAPDDFIFGALNGSGGATSVMAAHETAALLHPDLIVAA